MEQFIIRKVYHSDKKELQRVESLLQMEGIRLDNSIDYTCAIYTDGGKMVATGSSFKNTLRCIAIHNDYRGEGLMNMLISHLLEKQYECNLIHTFVYTKPSTSKFFKDLGFFPIVEIPDQLVFLENKRHGFQRYLEKLKKETSDQVNQLVSGSQAAIIMNANPFTNGHLALVERAAQENDLVHLFIVSEDSSLFPFSIREHLVKLGTAHLSNIVYHRTESYLISSATFPAYFQKSYDDVVFSQTALDASIFIAIAKELGITHRYVGTEPTSGVTKSYNNQLQELLPQKGITMHTMERKETDNNRTISASTVRKCIQEDDWETIASMVPTSTYDFLNSTEALPIIEAIKQSANVIHH